MGVPSQAPREAVLFLTGIRQRSFSGEDFAVKHVINREDLRFVQEAVVKREAQALQRKFDEHNIVCLPGQSVTA